MDLLKNYNVRGIDYLYLALYAFGGLGLEVLLAFIIEPKLYGENMSNLQNISHWIITCVIWAIMIFY